MSTTSAAPEMTLIADSIESANARIRFYRIAFGSTGANARVGRTEILSILTDLYRPSRVDVEWRVSEDMPRAEVKLAFLLILCAEATMPRGGRITVKLHQGQTWRVEAVSERPRDLTDEWLIFDEPEVNAAEATPATCHFLLAPRAANAMGRPITREEAAGGLTLSF